VHRPLPVDDPKRRRPDITRARKLLGWKPEVALMDGLPKTIAWFAEALGETRPQHRARAGASVRYGALAAQPETS
jgi:UDP-glucuronate decarboxylase